MNNAVVPFYSNKVVVKTNHSAAAAFYTVDFIEQAECFYVFFCRIRVFFDFYGIERCDL